MSIEAINWAFNQPIKKPSQKLVLLCLADFADDYGICWPRIKTVIKKTGISRETIFRCLKDLEAQNLIERVNRPTGDGSYTSNAYRLAFYQERIDDHPLSSLFKGRGCQNDTTPCQNDTGVVSQGHGGGVRMTPLDPSSNHQITKKEKKAASREEFLREINGKCQAGEFKDLGVTDESTINAQGNAAWDYWEGHNKFPSGNIYSAFKGWLRTAIASKRLDQKIIKAAGKEEVDPDDSMWRVRCNVYYRKGTWFENIFGSKPPDHPETKVPEHILQEFKEQGEQAHV